MNSLRIKYQFPWRFTNCNYYKFLLIDLPKSINYLGTRGNSKDVSKNKGTPYAIFTNYRNIHFIRESFKKIIRRFFSGLPNIRFTMSGDFDLIHCAHCLSGNKSPWICDIEFVGQFWMGGNVQKESSKKWIRKIVNSKNCKKILPWSEWARDGILKEFPELESKVEVLYPGIPYPKLKKKKNNNKITLLYVSRLFFSKGGNYAIEVMNKITRDNDNVEAIIISDIPEEIKRKYSENKKIKIYDLISNEKLIEDIYPISDILIYPSLIDTFGFALTEAMSYGLPIVTVEGHSRKEIVEDGKNGFLVSLPKGFDFFNLEKINLELLRNVKLKTEKLIKDKRLRVKMSRESRKIIREGKFSIKERNRKLERIFEEMSLG